MGKNQGYLLPKGGVSEISHSYEKGKSHQKKERERKAEVNVLKSMLIMSTEISISINFLISWFLKMYTLLII